MPDGTYTQTGVIAPVPKPAAPRNMCTDCGLSRTDMARDCGRACQFIRPDFTAAETRVHGRTRRTDTDELFFGPHRAMHRASLDHPRPGAQWTGITTALGERLLAAGVVQAVLTVGPDPEDRWKPRPIIVTRAQDMAEARGMRMGFAPLLSLLEPAREAGFRRIAIIGIPCQVHALRAIEDDLGFEAIHVIGTPCSDNTTTENFHRFLACLTDRPETVKYLEFRADYRVEIRFDDGTRRLIPFLKLPLADLPPDFFPLTCQTCTDYTNALADITVGYMGGTGAQWVIVRTERGAQMLDALAGQITLQAPRDSGSRAGAVAGFLTNTERAAGGLPLRRMPGWLRGIVGWLMPRIGPKGLEFARARVEMKAIETILHLRRARPAKLRSMVPDHIWELAAPYGLRPEEDELAPPDRDAARPFSPANTPISTSQVRQS